MGWSGNEEDQRFVGVIDNIRIYNRVLSGDEIENLRLEDLGQ
ncbi:hypothetical protein ACFL96_20365 [Thermoproteota archaeon]